MQTLVKNSLWFTGLFINAFCCSDIQQYSTSQGLGSVLQDLTPKVILSQKYHILPGTAGTELQVFTVNSVNK